MMTFSDFEKPAFTNLTSAIRALAMDAVQKANSGHPGMPMGMADIAEVLWNHHLRHNPADPAWPDRDRFVLSNGHGSMLLYALLHLSGYDLTIEDLKAFRQLHSKTPGHPEVGVTPGVETTTGPLGQGLANAVGMAIAEMVLARTFNRPGHEIVDHGTWVFLGDGCLMEGISHEACSLAGTLGLGKLTCFWDDNGISIDGHVSGWFTDDTPKRFEAYGWHVVRDVNGHDPEAIHAAILAAKAESARPTLICCKTVIGMGAPTKAGSHDVHGAPLGDAEIAATRPHIQLAPPAVRDPRRGLQGLGRAAARREDPGRVAAALRRLRQGAPRSRRGVHAAHGRRSARGLGGARRRHAGGRRGQGRDDRDAQGLAELHRGLREGAAGADRRLGRPRRLEPDALVRLEGRHPRARGATTSTSACASSA